MQLQLFLCECGLSICVFASPTPMSIYLVFKPFQGFIKLYYSIVSKVQTVRSSEYSQLLSSSIRFLPYRTILLWRIWSCKHNLPACWRVLLFAIVDCNY